MNDASNHVFQYVGGCAFIKDTVTSVYEAF